MYKTLAILALITWLVFYLISESMWLSVLFTLTMSLMGLGNYRVRRKRQYAVRYVSELAKKYEDNKDINSAIIFFAYGRDKIALSRLKYQYGLNPSYQELGDAIHFIESEFPNI